MKRYYTLKNLGDEVSLIKLKQPQNYTGDIDAMFLSEFTLVIRVKYFLRLFLGMWMINNTDS